jgi:N-acetylmuramic acid 6-phosphate etherase
MYHKHVTTALQTLHDSCESTTAAALAKGRQLAYVDAGTPVVVKPASHIHFQDRPVEGRRHLASGPARLTTAVERAEDDEEVAVRDLDAFGLAADDAVVRISASSRKPSVVAAILEGRRRSALSVSVACDSPLAALEFWPRLTPRLAR